jgi:hypothetical protein
MSISALQKPRSKWDQKGGSLLPKRDPRMGEVVSVTVSAVDGFLTLPRSASLGRRSDAGRLRGVAFKSCRKNLN